jgi:hypothetical protein
VGSPPGFGGSLGFSGQCDVCDGVGDLDQEVADCLLGVFFVCGWRGVWEACSDLWLEAFPVNSVGISGWVVACWEQEGG